MKGSGGFAEGAHCAGLDAFGSWTSSNLDSFEKDIIGCHSIPFDNCFEYCSSSE